MSRRGRPFLNSGVFLPRRSLNVSRVMGTLTRDHAHQSFDGERVSVEPKRPSVSLAALIAAGFRPDANEAIAIGQALCRTSTVAPPQVDSVTARSTPDLNMVLVDATGQVLIGDRKLHHASESVWTIAAVLLEILPRDSHWLFRNRILSQALSSPEHFTLAEFEQELSIYASADSAQLICALYNRWFTLHGKVADTAPPAIAAVVQTRQERRQFVAPVRAARAKYALAAIITPAVVLIVGASIFVGRSRPVAPTPAPPPVMTEVVPTAPSTTSDVPTARSTAAAKLSVDRPAADGRRRTRPTGPTNVVPPPVRNTPGAVIPATQAPMDHQPTDASSTGAANARIPQVAEIADSSASAPPQATTVAAMPGTAVIYSKADESVTPPVPIVPRSVAGLRPQSPDVRWDILTIEVVVDTKGRVDGVRGLVPPRNVGETMLLTQALSAIKSWPFKPAMKDGLPVAYRQTVRLGDLTRDEP